MKLVVYCLLAVTLCVLANAARDPRALKLREIMGRLTKFSESMQHNTLTLHTPSLNIQECCTLPAFECFRTQMSNITGCDKKLQKLLGKNLRDNLTMTAVNNSCTQENTENVPCDSCDTFPKRDTKQFMQQFELLLQKAYSGL